MKKIMPLTDVKVRNSKAVYRSVYLFDGGGLFLLVLPNTSQAATFHREGVKKLRKVIILNFFDLY